MQTTNRPVPAPARSRLQQAMREHPLAFFFLIAYAFSWLLLTPNVLSAWGLLPGDYTVLFVLHTFGPSLAGVLMTRVVEGPQGLARLRERIRQTRIGWPWYLLILLGIPALTILGIVVQPGALVGFRGLAPSLLVSYPLAFVAVWFGGGPLGEEIGWRGFALPRMQPRYGPLRGTLLLGVLWACWHLYEFLMPTQGGGPGTGLGTFLANFSLFLILVVGMAVLFTWLHNRTRQSLFAQITAHASVNTPQVILLPLFVAVDYAGLLRAGAIAFGLAALVVVVLTRGRLGYQP